MKQKTFYIPFENEYGYENAAPVIGAVGVLVERYWECGKSNAFSWRLDEAAVDAGGIPGNVNSAIRRYHGWRGTSYGHVIYAHGVRKVKAVRRVEKSSPDYEEMGGGYYAVTVGTDIHPDWD